jgi:aryl-alcohol dehydrogenase-like predicted oxidoreductase
MRTSSAVPEAALRFPLHHPAVASVLVSGRSPDEVRENADRVREPTVVLPGSGTSSGPSCAAWG